MNRSQAYDAEFVHFLSYWKDDFNKILLNKSIIKNKNQNKEVKIKKKLQGMFTHFCYNFDKINVSTKIRIFLMYSSW